MQVSASQINATRPRFSGGGPPSSRPQDSELAEDNLLVSPKPGSQKKPVDFSDLDLTDDKRVPVLITLPSGLNDDDCGGFQCPVLPRGERLELPLVNGFSTYVAPDRLEDLAAALPPGSSLTLNPRIRYPRVPQLLSDDMIPLNGEGRVENLPNIEKVWERGFTGKGQRIAVIDSGIAPHPDLKDKVAGWVDFSREKLKSMADTYGHGTHVAGVAAGSGLQSSGEVKGTAPDAELVGLRITTVAEAIKALQWVVDNKDEMNIGVVNMSLGEVARRGYKFDPWAQAVQKATEAGLVVVVAAGNEGPQPGSVSTPGIHPDAITVGAYDSKGTPDRSDDTVWSKSSQGPTIDGLHKPDVLAPGVAIFGPLAPGSHLDNQAFPRRGDDYFAVSGTSQATPMISGLASILLQANPELTSDDIKSIFKEASAPPPPHPQTGEPAADGAGLVDAERALDLALQKREAGVALA